jgi:hypothetical protein
MEIYKRNEKVQVRANIKGHANKWISLKKKEKGGFSSDVAAFTLVEKYVGTHAPDIMMITGLSTLRDGTNLLIMDLWVKKKPRMAWGPKKGRLLLGFCKGWVIGSTG